MSTFNKQARKKGYIGNAIRDGVMTKKYKKFYKDNLELNLPLPSDILFNQITKRFLDKDIYLTLKGQLRSKYTKEGYELSRGVLRQQSDLRVIGIDINEFGDREIDYAEAFKKWLTVLRTLNNRRFQISLIIDDTGVLETGEFTIRNNKLSSKLRSLILIYSNGELTNFYNEANRVGGEIRIKIFTPITTRKGIQRYLDGLNYHCVLHPIIKYYEELRDKSTTPATIKKYQSLVNKLTGRRLKSGIYKNGLLQDYKKGCYIEDLKKIVTEFPININIYSPLYLYEKTQKPIFSICCQQLYANKVFNYINTRSNHLDFLVCHQNETCELEKDDMKEQLETLKKEDTTIWKRQINGTVLSIMTPLKNYRLINDSKQIIEDFEKINNLQNNYIHSTNRFNDYILAGVHYNCCIDFNDIDTEYKHIDMEKAYFNSSKNPLFNKEQAFLSRCSYYANSNINVEYAINNVGYWRINNLNFDNVDKNTLQILNKMSDNGYFQFGYYNNIVYPHIDLKFLNLIGVTFDVIEGVYGLSQDIVFTEDMKKKFIDGKEDKKGIPLYSSWSGLQNSVANKNRVYMTGDKTFLENLQYDIRQIGKTEDIYINKNDNEAMISYNKKIVRHRSHITGYITAYQRTSTLLQLIKIKYDNIIRVVVDGIYYKGDTPKLISSFREQNQLIKSNSGGAEYITNNYICNPQKNEDVSEFEIPVSSTIYTGGGGTGKTFINMNKKNFLRVGYFGHSNKLCRATRGEFKNKECFISPYQWILQDNPELNKLVLQSVDVAIIDEASTLTYNDIKKIKYKMRGIPIIFMGDISHQTLPIDPPKKYKDVDGSEQWTVPEKYNVDKILTLFDKQIHLTKNYRFKNCKKQTYRAHLIREMMDKKCELDYILKYCCRKYGMITEDEMLNSIKYDDILLSSIHVNKDDLNEKISKRLKPKYIILKTKGQYFKGDVVFEEPDISTSHYEIRYCYTIHSVQGETLNDNQNLYIDSRKI